MAIKEKLEQSDVIYVNGGNTFYLLDWARKSGFADYLKELLEQGKVYFGVSAGSVIVGPNIGVAGWGPNGDANAINLKDAIGINLVPFATSPHFTEAERGVLERKLKEVSYPVVALTDEQAMLVNGDTQELIGEGKRINLHANF